MFSELDSFHYQSGFTVSYEKTTLYRIGSLRYSNAQMYSLDQFQWSNEDITVLGIKIAHEDILLKNYEPVVQKVKQTLNAWYNRTLSLHGKIQVVNTLIASLFVYKMIVLPVIPRIIVKKVDNLIREFLWNGKKSKIAYSILQNTKDQGGLNLVNLERKDKSLKASWPKILETEQEYAELVYQQLRCTTIKKDIWRCSLLKQDVVKLGLKNSFWQDVLMSWCEYNYYVNRDIQNQIIWYNSRITIKNTPFFWRDCYTKGLKYVHQLFKEQKFKSYEEVYEEYAITKLRYNSLKSTIPAEWREYFQNTPSICYLPIKPHNYDYYISGGINLPRKIYEYHSDDILLVHNKYIQWRQDLGVAITEGVQWFGHTIKEIYSLTNIPKYRSFQYRLLLRGLVTNIHLYKWGLKENDNCTFCKTKRESLLHLMYECTEVKELWNSFSQYVKQKGLDLENKYNSIYNNV